MKISYPRPDASMKWIPEDLERKRRFIFGA